MSDSDPQMLQRNRLVAWLSRVYLATKCQTDIEGWDPEWHWCVYIFTPRGQVSFHIHDSQLPLFDHVPHFPTKWDGHDDEEKWRRIETLTNTPKAGR